MIINAVKCHDCGIFTTKHICNGVPFVDRCHECSLIIRPAFTYKTNFDFPAPDPNWALKIRV